MARIIIPKVDDDTTDMLQRFILDRVTQKLPKNWRLTEVDLGKPEVTPGVCVRFDVEFQFEHAGPWGPDRPPTARDVIDLAQAVDYFCGAEDKKDRITIDGSKWHIGDGDDSSAVWQTGENRFAMWLRWFGE